jgi:type I restriction-modification system DNA methylase subunit
MKNERKTESLVRKYLQDAGYYDDTNIVVEEQKSDNPKINKLLKNASKKGNNQGYPEFIISSRVNSEFIIVIECKADSLKHKSESLDKYDEYAVDGALLYGAFLAKEYDTLVIGVSGQNNEELKISHYLYLKGANRYYNIFSDKILAFDKYYNGTITSEYKLHQDYDKLLTYAKTLNEYLHGKKIQESERALLISGILISLRNDAFKTGYLKHKSAKSLVESLYSTICTELAQSDLSAENVEKLKQAFVFIRENQTLNEKETGKDFTEGLITSIDQQINSLIETHKYFDAISQFYVEFLRYANPDKALGIVLTPRHITELYTEIANVNKDSVVFDNCCGTGGFLVACLRKMMQDANGDTAKEKKIKEKQLVGIEYQPSIYALLISNMMIHRDGKTGMYPGDCFTEYEKVKQKYSPTVGLLNPPYKTKGTPTEELAFVLNNLNTLEKNGVCVALVPMSCVTETDGIAKELKDRILQKHTLEAVMSMPETLFHGQANVVTCTLVITAHKPHPEGKKTWFGYWRDDGFLMLRHKGRIDANHSWNRIKPYWVNAFRNKEIIDKFSLTKEVTSSDEWCAEAYMETDYSDLKESDFIGVVKNYVAHRFLNKQVIL